MTGIYSFKMSLVIDNGEKRLLMFSCFTAINFNLFIITIVLAYSGSGESLVQKLLILCVCVSSKAARLLILCVCVSSKAAYLVCSCQFKGCLSCVFV